MTHKKIEGPFYLFTIWSSVFYRPPLRSPVSPMRNQTERQRTRIHAAIKT